MDCSNIFNKAISHKAKLENMEKDYVDNQFKIQRYEKDLNTLNSIYVTSEAGYDYLEALIKEESTRFIKRLNEILDYGVKTIFYDMNYSVDVRVEENCASIHLVYEDDDGNKLSPDIKYCGGGIRTVIGALLQLFFIFHYKTEKILIVDEGFSQVSSLYIPYFIALLKEMSDKNGLKILLITHDVRLMSYGDKVYEIRDGKSYLSKSRKDGE